MATEIQLSLPKPWPDFLVDIDHALSQAVDLHCIGGFILTALYAIPRPTGDIDYIKVVPREANKEIQALAGEGSDLSKKYKLSLQNVGVHDLPDDYESRLQELPLKLKKLKLWAVEPYDLLLSKVPRNSPKDREDAKYLIRKLNLKFETFYDRWQQEMAPWIPNRDRHEVTIKLWTDYFPKSELRPES